MTTQALVRKLDDVGDGSGNSGVTGDYSGGGAEDFLVQAGAAERIVISEIAIFLIDNVDMEPAGYAGQVAALTNGISVAVKKDFEAANEVTLYEIVSVGEEIKSNGEWARYGVQHLDNNAAIKQMVVVIALPAPIVLEPGMSLVFHVNDDFSFLNKQNFIAKGSLEKIKELA